MRSSTLLPGLVIVVALVAGFLALMSWRSDRAQAQLTPMNDVHWDGYVIEHELLSPGTRVFQVGHRIRVTHGNSLVLERDLWLENRFLLAGPRDFFAGLNVDSDPELELAVCSEGSIDSFFDAGSTTGQVRTVPGRLADQAAHDLCDVIGRNRPPAVFIAWCVLALTVPVLIMTLIRANRERREERRGRTTF